MLRWIIGLLVLLWIFGLILRIGGGLIHLLLVIAVLMFIYDWLVGRRRV